MVRASTLGKFDFSKFDPGDTWWWKKLRWTLDELAAENDREALSTHHMHWVTLASHGNLKPDSFDKVRTNAGKALNALLKSYYPWLADKIGEDGTKGEREAAVEAYREVFGKPGEERYEKMIDELTEYFKQGKRTKRQRERDRQRLRMQWNAQLRQQEANRHQMAPTE